MTNTNSGSATSTEVTCALCARAIQQQEPCLSQEPEGEHEYVHECCYIASELTRIRAENEAEARYDAFDTIIRNALRRQEARRARSLKRKSPKVAEHV
jgi:hypothetical protein